MKIKIAIGVVTTSVFVGFWFGNYLDNEVNTLNKKLEILKKEEIILKSQNKMYSLEVSDRVKDIDELSIKLDYIEDMIGLNHASNVTEMQRVDFAKMTTKERLNILQIIPNGSPTKSMQTTSPFGKRIHPISKKNSFHRGLDFKAKNNTPIYATADGVVKYVQSRNRGSFGRIIIISHNYGFETLYAHLNKTKVKIGDVVYKDNLIGYSGNSGRSSGPHLHYEIKYANKSLNPINFVKWNFKNYDFVFKKEKRVNWNDLINQIKVHQLSQNK